ncbi:hypothetical protein Vadar_034367 [Vaccinium darrowii]|uniref:Uncharacterized protein n=1 Tax=Vaccinium darrowii TaxID=229202 RepID=A0ACB7YRS4_9ERIC|nr:hypothetical protein Vadar_034367 [Vaccinium darrowii]
MTLEQDQLTTLQLGRPELDAPFKNNSFYKEKAPEKINVLAIALGNTVYLWDATDGATSELEKCYTVLAIALGNTVYLWDATDGATSAMFLL